jgi:probable phosphomutase (TIGR03848 family)
LTEFLLIRHAVNDFVKTGKLAGWTPGVHLNEDGRAQAAALGVRLAKTHIDAIYSSPLERTVETAQAVIEHHPQLKLQLLDDVGEVKYGTWQGAELGKLTTRKLWRAVQINPTRVRFPGGETMRAAQMRAVNVLEMLAEKYPRQRVAVVSHSDIIRMIVAHYLGVHLDLFQRIEISPASLTIIRLNFGRSTIVQVNESSFLPEPKKDAKDEREIDEIRPARSVVVDATGKPGERVFYLQAMGEDPEPVTFVMEKTQALMLANQIDELFGASGLVADVSAPPTLVPPQKVMFRVGRITLKYEDSSICMGIEEMLGEGQGIPRTVKLWTDPVQMRTLGDHARRVAQSGRQNGSQQDDQPG